MTDPRTRATERVRDLARQIEAKKKDIESAKFWDRGPLADDLAALRAQHHLACEGLRLEVDDDEEAVAKASEPHNIEKAGYEP